MARLGPEDTLRAVARGLQKTGWSPGDVFTHADKLHRRGELSRTQFEQALLLVQNEVYPPIIRTEISELFRYMDRRGTGTLSKKEFVSALTKALDEINSQRASTITGGRPSVVASRGPPIPSPTSLPSDPEWKRRPDSPGRGGIPSSNPGRTATDRTGIPSKAPGPSTDSLGSRETLSGTGRGTSDRGAGTSKAPGPPIDSPGRGGGRGRGSLGEFATSGRASPPLGSRSGTPGPPSDSPRSGGGRGRGSLGEIATSGRGSPPLGSRSGMGSGAISSGSPSATAFTGGGRGCASIASAKPSSMAIGTSGRAVGHRFIKDLHEVPLESLEQLDLQSEGEDKGSGRMLLRDGSYDWIRKDNAPRDRDLRMEAARQTLAACHHESYFLDGKIARLVNIKRMLDGTKILRYAEDMRSGVPTESLRKTEFKKLPPGVALTVAASLARENRKVGVVNAASAYHAGGGFFTGGRHALEEAMCMQTTLSKSLQVGEKLAASQGIRAPSSARPPRPYGKLAWECHIPDDGIVLSPHVEIFRGGTADGYPFFEQPVTVAAILSVAMPNANDRMRDAPVDMPVAHDEYLSLISKKFHTLAKAAVEAGVTHLVMVDAGCGVYGNNPRDVGCAFGKVIYDFFPRAFAEILLVGGKTFADSAQFAGENGFVSPEGDEENKMREVSTIFRKFDLNQDGKITRAELGQVLGILDKKSWDDKTIDIVMDSVDVAGEGFIRYDELFDWLKNKPISSNDPVGQSFAKASYEIAGL